MYFVIVFYYSEKPMTIKLSKLCYFTGWIQVVLTYQLFTNCTDGVPSNLSGRRSISFSMFANLTGSSCRKNAKEVLSHPLVEPMNKSKTRVSTTIRCLSTHFRAMALQSQCYYWPVLLSACVCLCWMLFTWHQDTACPWEEYLYISHLDTGLICNPLEEALSKHGLLRGDVWKGRASTDFTAAKAVIGSGYSLFTPSRLMTPPR